MGDINRDRTGIMKAFADPTRLRIIEILKEGEKCVCVLTEKLGMPQSTLSYHMKILQDAGVVERTEVGKWSHYQLSADGRKQAIDILQDILF
ncbi:MAG: ArsR/SmtB family transcription factor [Bullifex sp.]